MSNNNRTDRVPSRCCKANSSPPPRRDAVRMPHENYFAILLAIRRPSSRVRLAHWGHRLGLASLMDGTIPPLPSNYRPFLLRDRNSWAETTLRATSASFIPEWKPRNGSKNTRQRRSFYFVVASE
jgi:hypothetical protein